MTHFSTGIKVMVDGRDQHKNKRAAFKEMTKRINHFYKTGHMLEKIEVRKSQIGDGSTSSKRRTYNVKTSMVVDHITNKTARLKDVLRGKIELLR